MFDGSLEVPETAQRGSAQRKAALLLALGYYWRALKKHKSWSIPAMILPAIGDIFVFYIPPIVVAHILGRLAHGDKLTAGVLAPYVLIFSGILLLGEVFWRLGIHCLNRADGRGIEDLYVDGMDALLAKDAVFFHDNFAGSLTKRVLSFASKFEEFVDTVAFEVVASLVPLVFASVVLWRYDPRLVAVLLGLIVVTGAVITPLINRRQALVDDREAAWARVSGHVADTLSNMDAVRAFGAEAQEATEHRKRVRQQRDLAIRSWDFANLRIDTIVSPISVLTNATGLILALALGGGQLGVEAIFVTFTYYSRATQLLFRFNQIYRRLESALTDAAQFTELLLTEPTVLDPADPMPLAPADSSVRFERVIFAHDGEDAALFNGLDLTVASGERIGLVGRSGGGKSTLTRLLLRLMDVDSGRILIGGQDISLMRQVDLRSLIAYVPQDPVMFHRSLHDNIAFGRPDASDEEVWKAAEAAHAVEFIEQLPLGFNTLVGERGVKLSGGQRQRIAIARAILRDAPILLLDEATSALDSESEAFIQTALWRLMDNRTTLVVAHRLSTVVRMDRMVVLDRGEVVEEGPHDVLLRRSGIYADLWRRQSGGFLDDEDLGARPDRRLPEIGVASPERLEPRELPLHP